MISSRYDIGVWTIGVFQSNASNGSGKPSQLANQSSLSVFLKTRAWHGIFQNKTKKKMKWNWTVRMITLVEINDTFVSGNIKPISGTVGSAAKPSVGWRINPFFSTSFTRAWYGKLQKSGMTYFHSSTFTHSPGIAVWRHLSHSGNAWGKRNKLRNWWIYECYQCFLQEHDTESSKTRNWNV